MIDIIQKFILYLFPNFILVASMIVFWHKILNTKIDFRNHRLYITVIGIIVISILNYVITQKFIRIILVTIIFMIFFKYLFRESLQKTIVTPIFYQVIVLLAEYFSFFLLLLLLNSKTVVFLETYLGVYIINILVASFVLLVLKFKFTRKIYNRILSFTDRIKTNQLILFSLIVMIFLNIFIINAYYKIKFEYWIILNLSLIFILFMIVLFSFKTQNKYNKVSDKYNIAIKSLNDYENMMSKYRVSNHENKNLLLTIRAMILNKEKDIPKYIDTMIEDKYEDDEKLLFKMGVIPTGGLRATIYSEIMKIKDNEINYSLNIDKKLRSVDLIELDTNTIIDICKIIGVFIDNAIDEVKRLKNKNIDISIYIENKMLNIRVSNNYEGKIEINKISNSGYTTKGKGHGYGLSLVKEIVKNNNLFENKQQISKDVFSQILIIKYKKSHE